MVYYKAKYEVMRSGKHYTNTTDKKTAQDVVRGIRKTHPKVKLSIRKI